MFLLLVVGHDWQRDWVRVVVQEGRGLDGGRKLELGRAAISTHGCPGAIDGREEGSDGTFVISPLLLDDALMMGERLSDAAAPGPAL